MDLSGEHEIAAPRETVWAALNDPDILKQAIPGCQHIEKSGDNAFSAKVKVKVGPVNATFSGNVTLENLNPPESYTITGEGTGGAAGFAKGGADVHLEELSPETTKLSYKVNAQVGGKLAQVGQRLIKSTADKYAKQFFDTFTEVVGQPREGATEGDGAESAGETDAESDSAGAAPAGSQVTAPATSPESPEETAAPTTAATSAAPPADAAAGDSRSRALHPAIWVGGVIVLILVLLGLVTL